MARPLPCGMPLNKFLALNYLQLLKTETAQRSSVRFFIGSCLDLEFSLELAADEKFCFPKEINFAQFTLKIISIAMGLILKSAFKICTYN